MPLNFQRKITPKVFPPLMHSDLTGMIAWMERSSRISKTSFSIHRNVLNGSPGGLSYVERYQQKTEATSGNDCFHFRFFFIYYYLFSFSQNYSCRFSRFLFESFNRKLYFFFFFVGENCCYFFLKKVERFIFLSPEFFRMWFSFYYFSNVRLC